MAFLAICWRGWWVAKLRTLLDEREVNIPDFLSLQE
jgi:hypothetical protein